LLEVENATIFKILFSAKAQMPVNSVIILPKHSIRVWIIVLSYGNEQKWIKEKNPCYNCSTGME
jgi:hypothetical protein